MISVKNILTITRYESKVLWRNWFFRIVSLIGIIFVTIFNIAVFSEVDDPRWFVLSNSWMMPYSAMLMISIPQAAAVIFLATGLIKKDKKVDTNEVFFVRPISNLDYVLGKALALIKLFFYLNMVLLCIPLVVNLTNPFTTFNPLAFIFYPLATSMPTIIFTTGIAFLLVTLLKNQPISIVLLLGIAGVQIIYYFDHFSNILDFTAFRLSLHVSEIAGFVDLEFALRQRLFYLVTGIAMLFLTAFFLDRLASHRKVKMATGIIGISLLVFSTFMMLKLWEMRQDPISFREKMIAINDEWTQVPNVDMISNYIDLAYSGHEIICSAELTVKNNTDQNLNKIFFTLNPDLTVNEVLFNSQLVEFTRNVQVMSLSQQVNLAPGEEAKVKINYRGTINASIAYLEVDQDRYESANDYFMYSLQKKYAFFQPDYALLTKDVFWYPDTRIGYSKVSTSRTQHSFVDFKLKVKTPGDMIPISQGKLVLEDGVYQFNPEYPLPQISLVIGKYVKKEITVDSVTYAIYHYPQNDYFIKQLGQLEDTVSYLITDMVNEFEDAQKLSFPFNRLQFVETPIQFTAYNKIYESHQAFIQPETVFWPEEGGSMRHFDFRRQLRDMQRQSRENNQVLTDKQMQANVFKDLIKNIYTKQAGSQWFFDGRNEDEPDYSLFPNYYDFNSGFVDPDWPLLNRSIATYLRNDAQAQNDFSRNINGISFTEECNMLMREKPLDEILTEEGFNKIQKSVSLKSQNLFAYLGQLIGEENLKDFLYQWVNSHQHQLTDYESLRQSIVSQFNVDIDPIIKKVYFDQSQAAFEILDIQKYEVLDGDRTRYQVLMEIKNSGENDGVVDVKFTPEENTRDGGSFRGRFNEQAEKFIPGRPTVINQGETKLLGFVLDEKPREIILNTIISRNIPSEITLSVGTLSKRSGGSLYEGERILMDEKIPTQYEVIVDNEDPGFTTFSPIKPTYLRAFLDSRSTNDRKYYGQWSRSYSKWLPTTGSDFYGSVIRSAHFTRSGKGEKTTTWTPALEEEGFYDIYVFLRGKNQQEFQGRNGDNRQFSYHYVVNHGDGKDQIEYNLSNANPGWNYLGSYFFNKTGGNVSLTDECDLRNVYADAIKWVKQ